MWYRYPSHRLHRVIRAWWTTWVKCGLQRGEIFIFGLEVIVSAQLGSLNVDIDDGLPITLGANSAFSTSEGIGVFGLGGIVKGYRTWGDRELAMKEDASWVTVCSHLTRPDIDEYYQSGDSELVTAKWYGIMTQRLCVTTCYIYGILSRSVGVIIKILYAAVMRIGIRARLERGFDLFNNTWRIAKFQFRVRWSQPHAVSLWQSHPP